MAQAILTLISLLLVGFWGWMLSDMMRNDDLPSCFIMLSGGNDENSGRGLSG